LTNHCIVSLTSQEEGKSILSTRDVYVQCLSSFERSARRNVEKSFSEEEFMLFQANQVLPWPAEDIENLKEVIASLNRRLEKFGEGLNLPPKLVLNLTTGKEEGGAAFCRGSNGIFLPRNQVNWSLGGSVEALLAHELWHIVSRNLKPGTRDKAYSLIGFEALGTPLEFPTHLQPKRITNPDAALFEHYLPLSFLDGSETINLVPITISNTTIHHKDEGTFFKYVQLTGLIVQRSEGVDEGEGKWALTNELFPMNYDGLPKEFWEKIGRNTSYIIHPEEIMADNFKMLVFEEHLSPESVPTPSILYALDSLLRNNTD